MKFHYNQKLTFRFFILRIGKPDVKGAKNEPKATLAFIELSEADVKQTAGVIEEYGVKWQCEKLKSGAQKCGATTTLKIDDSVSRVKEKLREIDEDNRNIIILAGGDGHTDGCNWMKYENGKPFMRPEVFDKQFYERLNTEDWEKFSRKKYHVTVVNLEDMTFEYFKKIIGDDDHHVILGFGYGRIDKAFREILGLDRVDSLVMTNTYDYAFPLRPHAPWEEKGAKNYKPIWKCVEWRNGAKKCGPTTEVNVNACEAKVKELKKLSKRIIIIVTGAHGYAWGANWLQSSNGDDFNFYIPERLEKKFYNQDRKKHFSFIQSLLLIFGKEPRVKVVSLENMKFSEFSRIIGSDNDDVIFAICYGRNDKAFREVLDLEPVISYVKEKPFSKHDDTPVIPIQPEDYKVYWECTDIDGAQKCAPITEVNFPTCEAQVTELKNLGTHNIIIITGAEGNPNGTNWLASYGEGEDYYFYNPNLLTQRQNKWKQKRNVKSFFQSLVSCFHGEPKVKVEELENMNFKEFREIILSKNHVVFAVSWGRNDKGYREALKLPILYSLVLETEKNLE